MTLLNVEFARSIKEVRAKEVGKDVGALDGRCGLWDGCDVG